VYSVGGQSYCVGLWTGHRYKEPFLQAAHACWSLGAAIGPLIIGQFLVELPQTYADIDNNKTLTSSSVFDPADTTAMMSYDSLSVGTLIEYSLSLAGVFVMLFFSTNFTQ